MKMVVKSMLPSLTIIMEVKDVCSSNDMLSSIRHDFNGIP